MLQQRKGSETRTRTQHHVTVCRTGLTQMKEIQENLYWLAKLVSGGGGTYGKSVFLVPAKKDEKERLNKDEN